MTYVSNLTRPVGDPRILQTGGSSMESSDRLGRALGWFSLGLGTLELIAPRRVARALGLRGRRNLLWAFGAREIGGGILSLSVDKNAGLWSRIGGDVLDLVALGTALRPGNPKRGNVKLVAAMVIGVTVLDIIAAQAVTSRHVRDGSASRRYADRSGFPRGIDAARKVARARSGV